MPTKHQAWSDAEAESAVDALAGLHGHFVPYLDPHLGKGGGKLPTILADLARLKADKAAGDTAAVKADLKQLLADLGLGGGLGGTGS